MHGSFVRTLRFTSCHMLCHQSHVRTIANVYGLVRRAGKREMELSKAEQDTLCMECLVQSV